MSISTAPAVRVSDVERPVLPVLPPGLPFLLTALGDEDTGSQDWAAALLRFPPIAGRVIALANCAWASPRRPITGLPEACALLGLRVVRSVSIALAVAKIFNASRCPGFDARRFWCTALLTAEGAAVLAQALRGDLDPGTMSAAGLLHNLGLLWMADESPEETSAAFRVREGKDSPDLVQALRKTTGTDYCEKGGLLGEAWGLPEALIVAMRHHRTPGYAGPQAAVASGVGAVAQMVATLGREDDTACRKSARAYPGVPPAAAAAVCKHLEFKWDTIRGLAKSLMGDERFPSKNDKW
ncbi:MAG: HDOD domain-containing protein [Pseudomonadota bacterium]